MIDPKHVAAATSQFAVGGNFLRAEPYGSGHINDTFRAVYDRRGEHHSTLLQRINHHIFKNPAALMSNIERVTAHITAQVADHPDASRRALHLIPTRDGAKCHRDPEGNWWRMYQFVERARSYDSVETPRQAYQAAYAFGQFQHQLATLPAPRLSDTIPDFHHTPKRFAALESAVSSDTVNRAIHAAPEIAFALARQPITGILLQADLPERVTHNDTKFNNVLLDDETGEGLCVIDLDTVMPGLALYDFGDMVRTATSPAAEDERDLSRVCMRMPMFEALVRGYLAAAGSFLTPAEKQYLAFSGKLITFEIGLRFLTDYLAGDTYYKVHRLEHNLDRCRTQFQLVKSIEEREDQMMAFVQSCER
jgi:aminoglycoside phosphotransferase (APT) family kinase protein